LAQPSASASLSLSSREGSEVYCGMNDEVMLMLTLITFMAPDEHENKLIISASGRE
jgi:hypothetical protein